MVRMTQRQRIQHLLLLTSFIALAVTGFALKYPDSWLAIPRRIQREVRRCGSPRRRRRDAGPGRVPHRLHARDQGRPPAAEGFLPAVEGRPGRVRQPALPDLPAGRKPAFARFGYAEKAEYWAVVWGTVHHGPDRPGDLVQVRITEWAPRWVIDVAITIHYYEAILAVLAIIVWHFYHVIFDPDVYPMNTAWWDGRVSEHWYREEHGLDTESRKETAGAAKQAKASDQEPVASDQ